MRYTVRTQEGELVFESFGEVERAWLMGLVEPDDEVLEEGSNKWRKAGSIPVLARARRHGDQVWGGTQMAWILGAIVFCSASLYLLVHGRYLMGGLLAIAVTVVLFRVTQLAHRRTRPHGPR